MIERKVAKVWKRLNLKIWIKSSFWRKYELADFADLLIITVSEPIFNMLPAITWKFLITPKRVMPMGPEKIATHLLIARPETKIATWNAVVEKIPAALDKTLFLMLILNSLYV